MLKGGHSKKSRLNKSGDEKITQGIGAQKIKIVKRKDQRNPARFKNLRHQDGMS